MWFISATTPHAVISTIGENYTCDKHVEIPPIVGMTGCGGIGKISSLIPLIGTDNNRMQKHLFISVPSVSNMHVKQGEEKKAPEVCDATKLKRR